MPPALENQFQFEVRRVIVRDDRGRYWYCKNLQAGEKKTVDPLTQKDASKVLGQVYNDYRPLSTVRETSQRQRRYDDEIFDVIVDTSRRLDAKVIVTEGLFEQWLQQHLQTMGELPESHFVATADVTRDVLAVDQSELAASIRYLFGTLR